MPEDDKRTRTKYGELLHYCPSCGTQLKGRTEVAEWREFDEDNPRSRGQTRCNACGRWFDLELVSKIVPSEEDPDHSYL